MGLDAYLMAAHNKKQLDTLEYWEQAKDIRDMDEYMWDKPAELWYARKFWGLHSVMSQHFDLDNGDWVELSKKDLEYMLDIACHNTDYWSGFNSAPAICQVIHNYDTLRENGLSVFYGGNY